MFTRRYIAFNDDIPTANPMKYQQFPVKIERALFKGLLRIFKYFFAKCFFDKIITA